jgi:hypothetical protein
VIARLSEDFECSSEELGATFIARKASFEVSSHGERITNTGSLVILSL